MVFLGLSASYLFALYATGNKAAILHPIFLANSSTLIASSVTMHLANRAYRADRTLLYQRMLAFTLALTVVFLIVQIIGYATLIRQGYLSPGNVGGHYVYALFGLHFLHVVGGIPFLAVFLWVACRRMREPVSVLVYFSDPEKRLRLRLITVYWHFLDALWILLLLLFAINWAIGYIR
jgi:cytochrome c oxidase subunit 3